jgi:hypothetical protein
MNRQTDDFPRRDPRFSQTYRAESERMRRAPQAEKSPQAQPPMRDAAVILPLLLLLMTEGADRYLLLSLLYILM